MLANSVGVWVNLSANMEHVPLGFRTLRDGSVFLQHHASGLHIYFSVATIKKACEAGLHSVVADGMHSLHPKTLG
ncbi:hypothetical protein V3C99_017881 [Haemonchus contortus]|nr:unnamed protein product [Haemonchus contortus]